MTASLYQSWQRAPEFRAEAVFGLRHFDMARLSFNL